MRYAGVKLPVRILKPPMRVVRTIITITFILFPSFVVIAETIVSNTPASVSIWKYRNANKSINPADFIMGDSSGGHTAVLAGITAGQDILDTEDYNEFSCEVKAIVDFYGVTDVRQKEDFPTTLNQGEPDSPEGKLIGGNNVYEHPELSVPVTCANYVEKDTPIPPILMMHGTGDDTVSWRQSVRLYKKLREEEKDVTFYMLENAVHGDNAFWTTENLNIVDEFLKKHI